MKILKHRKEPEELVMMRSLNARMHFSKEQKNQLIKMEKGFEGEQIFDAHLDEKLNMNCLILNDLLFEFNNTLFQIDNLMIAQDSIYFNDVKNHEGDYMIDSKGRWYTLDKKERKDPIMQLDRGLSLFRSMLQELQVSLSVAGYIIFVNPEFYLYHASVNPTIIFPSQINRFIRNLNQSPSKVRPNHMKLADKLLSLHIAKSPYSRIPAYSYDQLEKGIRCGRCGRLTRLNYKMVYCNACHHTEKPEFAVLRSVEEFVRLFPDKKITTTIILDWCKILNSRDVMRTILLKNFRLIGGGKASYFEKKEI